MKNSDKLTAIRKAAEKHYDTDRNPFLIVMAGEDNASDSGLDPDSEEYAISVLCAIEGSIAPRGDYGQYGELFAKWGF